MSNCDYLHGPFGPGCPHCAPRCAPTAAGIAAQVLGQYMADWDPDDVRDALSDLTEVRVYAAAPQSLCRKCMAPITLTDGQWTSDGGSSTCRTGRPHEPMAGA